MDNLNVVLASMRAVSNEIRHVKAVPEALYDEQHYVYQCDLEEALSGLIAVYGRLCAADARLTEWQKLLAFFERSPWPEAVEAA